MQRYDPWSDTQVFNYNIGFENKIVRLMRYDPYNCYDQFRDNLDSYKQNDLLEYELDKEIVENIEVYRINEVNVKYHAWIKESFSQGVFIIKDEYFNPDKVISCKIHLYDKDFSVPVKLKAFKVKESPNEMWLKQIKLKQ